MALPSAVNRLLGMIFLRVTLVPPKQPVRFAGVLTLPSELRTRAVQVAAGLVGSRRTPSSSVPTIPSGPRNRNEKFPLRSALVGIFRRPVAEVRRMIFHSSPPKMKNLSLMIGPPRLPPKLL